MSKTQEPSRRKPFTPLVALSVAAVLVVGFTFLARAEDPPATQDPATEEEVDLYAVPETDDLEVLGSYIESLQNFQPTSREEYVEYQERGLDAMVAAAEQIMEQNPEEGSGIYQQARGVLLQSQIGSLFEADAATRAQLVDDILTHVEGADIGIPEARLSMTLAQALGYLEDKELEVSALERLVAAFEGQDSPLMNQVAGTFEGLLMRAQLVGSVMEISGETIDGEEFNIESLRGRVVLVDFWATWCPPCVGEHPNIMQNYEKYHDQGFEVVGISLDDDRAALVDYITEHEVPWISLHGEASNQAAEAYGINAIPAMFLLDEEGKVISDEARGEELNRLLAEIYGEADAPSEKEPAEEGADAGDTGSTASPDRVDELAGVEVGNG